MTDREALVKYYLDVSTMNLSMYFYVLVEGSTPSEDTLEAGGRQWQLERHDLDRSKLEELTYICVSYTWGTGREPSPIHADYHISDRTIPVLDTVARLRPNIKRIWIDALCVPQEVDDRYHNLESMGYIYSQAQEVIAVLSPAVRPVLDYMSEHQALNRDHIPLLEAEDWVTRAWTYQEAVNARSLSVTCDGYDHDALLGDQFLNHVGHAISQLKLPASVLRQRYPRLDAMEDLCDYLLAGYAERSALQVMAMMDRRMQHHPEDHFFAMIGALSQIRASEVGTQNPCESFMTLCELKGDYSFIFSDVPRETVAGWRWRPTADPSHQLPVILSW